MDQAYIDQFVSGQNSIELNSPEQGLQGLLRTIRTHLDMDVAFVSEFTEGRRYFRHVDALKPDAPVRVGDSDPLEDSYCQRVIDGRLPQLIQDAQRIPAARELPVTAALPVGAHLSVPLVLKDGSTYGTFCCFSSAANESLNERDLKMMRVFADMASAQIDRSIESQKARHEMEDRIHSVLQGNALAMVYQPIYKINENRIVGFESLARFNAEPRQTPDVWFGEAAQVGLGATLEIEAAKRAFRGIPKIAGDYYVAINLSPDTIRNAAFKDLFTDIPIERVVLEITEHAAINFYTDVVTALRSLRDKGLRLAVDDAGAGYSSFRHILSLAPDIIKLDMSIVRNIDVDNSRRALAAALMGFARSTGSAVVAEGVETASELLALRDLGINNLQGYLLGKPMPIEVAASLLATQSEQPIRI